MLLHAFEEAMGHYKVFELSCLCLYGTWIVFKRSNETNSVYSEK